MLCVDKYNPLLPFFFPSRNEADNSAWISQRWIHNYSGEETDKIRLRLLSEKIAEYCNLENENAAFSLFIDLFRVQVSIFTH